MPFGLSQHMNVDQIRGEEYLFSPNVQIVETKCIILVTVSRNLVSPFEAPA